MCEPTGKGVLKCRIIQSPVKAIIFFSAEIIKEGEALGNNPTGDRSSLRSFCGLRKGKFSPGFHHLYRHRSRKGKISPGFHHFYKYSTRKGKISIGFLHLLM